MDHLGCNAANPEVAYYHHNNKQKAYMYARSAQAEELHLCDSQIPIQIGMSCIAIQVPLDELVLQIDPPYWLGPGSPNSGQRY